MKFIGQYIQSFIARFRNDVYLEDIDTGTIASGGNLGLDSNNKIVKADEATGDVTGVALTASTGIDLTSVSGATGGAYAATIGVDVSDFMSSGVATSVLTAAGADTMQAEPYFTFRNSGNISTLALFSNEDTGDTFNIQTTTHGATTLSTTDDDATAAHFKIAADGDVLLEPATGDLTMYNAVNDGNPTISLGSSATNRLEIKTGYNSGAQTLDEVYFSTYTTSSTTNDGRYIFEVDEVELGRFLDGGISWNGFIHCKEGLRDTNTTTSSATEGGRLQLQADDGAAMGDDHRLGVIEFKGAEDASATRSIGARIQAICRDAWDGSTNDADLEFYTTDGTTESKVLTLDADKLATFTGAVTVTGALSGTLATASQTNITGVGTITTGVWNGTAIATDQQKHLASFDFKGYGTHDGTNYEIPQAMTDTNAPFEHNTSVGSAGTTAINVSLLLRAGGHVMPYAGTVKKWTGWAAGSGSGTINLALFRYRPDASDSSAQSLVLIDDQALTAAGAQTVAAIEQTSFTDGDIAAGDIIMTGIKGVSGKTTYFTSTMEIEWD